MCPCKVTKKSIENFNNEKKIRNNNYIITQSLRFD